ncbi:tyrosine-protein phosphatase [Microlunatus soli]|uniref:Tyrosine phosphatase family C-terminal region n=1 Tax=Microlunatus soli TaxID=630515 RepID=A0A1H1QWM6_9ACTN|nr:tyrosine-protein phosphatase [Microlunatus soli]SDS27874.1 Tyrosine phosphatase family C-terminal region [Microlunatus soli]
MTDSITESSVPPLAPVLANLREVGGPGFQAGRRRLVYRSNTRAVGADAYPTGLSLILDLRRIDEIDRLPHPLREHPGYRQVPLFDPASEIESAAEAVQLEEQYVDWLQRHRAAIPAVFLALARPSGDALVCCSAGKDRTGVVSAVLARLWGADLDRIGADYAASGAALADQFAAELAATGDRDHTLIQQRCVPVVMTTVIEHIEDRYGSVAEYLLSLGLTAEQIDAL